MTRPARRYLGQLATYFVFPDHNKGMASSILIMRVIRNGAHYRREVFEVASRVIAFLVRAGRAGAETAASPTLRAQGMYNYSSFHVRR